MARLRIEKVSEDPQSELVALRLEVSTLQQQTSHQLTVEAELQTAMENLAIHQEELRAQNDSLRQTQEELEESRHQFVDLFEAAPIGYFILDAHGCVEKVNFKGAELLGYSRDYLLHKPLLPYLTHPSRMAFSAHFNSIVEQITSAAAEIDCLHSSGRLVHVRVESVVIEEGKKRNARRYRTAFVDITERKLAEEALLRTERRLRQTHKMEAIGTLAGGIAHDFNNILMGMIGFTELTQMQLPSDSPLHLKLNEVMVAGCRARDLIRQILKFSRQTEPEKHSLQLSTLINETLQLLTATLPSTILIRSNVEAESTTVFADPTEIHQMLMNLCTNAEYAMREIGGLLEVNLKELEISAEWAKQHPPLKPGPYLYLSVRDTGPGMRPEVVERIFDPFFTTKALGEGTGMGLAMVHGIIANHNGIVRVEHTGLQGTMFGVYLPTYIDSSALRAEKASVLPRKNGRILFVDDEAVLVRMGEELLQQLGYDVQVSRSGEEALALFQDDPHYFDVVVTDQTMPQVTGEVLAKKLIELRPSLPIILCTGFSHVMTPEKAKSMGIFSFLMKPLILGELDHAIQSALSVS